MTVSVIIPTKNRLKDLLVTIEHICDAQTFPDEIIIIDQTANDQRDELDLLCKEKKCDLNISYYHTPEIRSLIDARNFGFSRSSGDVVLFLDDDITVSRDFFTVLSNTYVENPDLDAVCAVNTLDENLSILRVIARCIFWIGPFWDNRTIANKFYRKFKKPIRSSTFSGGYMSCKRIVFINTGFDTNLTGHVFVDDIDFSYRASKNYTLFIAPRLRVIHRGGFTPLYDIEEADRKRVHSRRYFFNKNIKKTLFNYIAFLWLMFGTFLSSIARSVFNFSFKPIRGFIRGMKCDLKN